MNLDVAIHSFGYRTLREDSFQNAPEPMTAGRGRLPRPGFVNLPGGLCKSGSARLACGDRRKQLASASLFADCGVLRLGDGENAADGV
jgi:hypothetical protein